VAAPLRYTVDLSRRLQHLVGVTLQVPDDLPRPVRLVMPTWTAGSYVMRDYVHHVQSIAAQDGDGRDLALTPDGHTAWVLEGDATDVEVSWELYANDLTVRTNHVDDHHALLVGPATFVVIPDARDRRHQVTVHSDMPVWSLLTDGGDGTHVAADMDHLLDAAFESGEFPHVEVDVDGTPHRFVWSGHGGAPDMDRIATTWKRSPGPASTCSTGTCPSTTTRSCVLAGTAAAGASSTGTGRS
jgi:predicted metalloprotease with PDZ domain